MSLQTSCYVVGVVYVVCYVLDFAVDCPRAPANVFDKVAA
jgi:hypothetical protein